MKKQATLGVSLLLLASCMADPSEIDPNVGPYDDEESVEDVGAADVGAAQAALTNADDTRSPMGLVRLDFVNGWCSGFFIAPNMIAASSHCVANRRDPGGTWHGMDWGHLQVRIVYKPSSDEVMCINEPCRNSNGSRRFTTVLAWSDADYDGGTDDSLAILTRVQGLDFPTRPADWNGPTPRALSDTQRDFIRILDVHSSTGHPRVNAYGYGFFGDDDDEVSLAPRRGHEMTITPITGETGRNEGSSTWMCDGDEGGPAVLEIGPHNSSLGIERRMAWGVFSTNAGLGAGLGHCGSQGTHTHWARLDAKEWMIEEIMGWAGRPGSTSCRHFSQAYDLVGLDQVANYLRCW